METKKHQIAYHKIIDKQQAERLFKEGFEPYVTEILMKNGMKWVKNEDGSIELVKHFTLI